MIEIINNDKVEIPSTLTDRINRLSITDYRRVIVKRYEQPTACRWVSGPVGNGVLFGTFHIGNVLYRVLGYRWR